MSIRSKLNIKITDNFVVFITNINAPTNAIISMMYDTLRII